MFHIKEHMSTFILFVLCVAIFSAAFGLYHLPIEAVLYPAVLCAALIVTFALARFFKQRKKFVELSRLQGLPDNLCEVLKEYDGQTDEYYRAIIGALCERETELMEADRRKFSDMIDYYTTWAHQIKTPIASMRLTLQNEDSATARKLIEDLFRIEQYVEMVLCYLRLDSDNTDYVFREHLLDNIIKGCLRKYAGQFISKGIRLEYAGTDERVVTDEKWLTFVIEQVLSNALKYTSSGSISVYMEDAVALCIRDTGMGVAPEDMPRIFEKGYTGFNGRTDKKASGLGLYLCRRICNNLNHSIAAESTVGIGTTIKIGLSKKKACFE